MIKKLLLASSVLSLGLAANAAEKEVYVIKDGKMVNCEFNQSTTSTIENSYEVYEGENSLGDPMVVVKNPDTLYKSAFLYLPEAIDLNETWNLEVEYFFEEGTELTAGCEDHECWVFDLLADTMAAGSSTWGYAPAQKDYRIAHVSIDARYRDFVQNVDGLATTTNYGVGKLRTVRKYVYSSPLMPKALVERGDANKVKVIYLAMFPEADAEIYGYIKNLKFVSDGTKPFYADKFTNLAGEGTIYMKTMSNHLVGTNGGDYNDEEIGALSDVDIEPGNPTTMYGQQMFISQSTDGYFNQISNDRLYQKKNEQEEAEFFDTEYGFLPFLSPAPGKPGVDRTDEDEVNADAQIRIPLGKGAVEKMISIAMRLGHNAGTSGGKGTYEMYRKSSKDNERFPVEYRFEKGDAQYITDKTEWMQFRPTYTKGGDDYVDSIPTMMYMVYGDVELPSKEYTHITLRVIPNDIISIMFTDFQLTGDIKAWPKSADDYTLGKDYKGNMVPVSFKTSADVKNVIAKGEVSIYPNPASDVITVANEGVKSVAVYTVAGSLVASSESNTVNVASLANGIYVVKANTEAGVITGQIIKK